MNKDSIKKALSLRLSFAPKVSGFVKVIKKKAIGKGEKDGDNLLRGHIENH